MKRAGTLALLAAAVALAALTAAHPARAQQSRDETLADIRQELSVLYVEVQRLKRELSTTGGVSAGLGNGTLLQRVDQLENELARLTARTEQLQKRVETVVKDGTKRIGDLEYRLVELEGGDVSKLGETSTLGGDFATDALEAPAPPATAAPDDAPELAVGEQRDFDQARAALEAGDNLGASQQFAAFNDTYPGSPLAAEASFLRGKALTALGDTANAARAYLESFSGAPDGPRAPEALLQLGVALGQLGQTNEACVALGQVGVRFADSAAVDGARNAMQDIGCP